jgi:hypothetical protein
MTETPVNHGRVTRELVEYADGERRIVICELTDGWHVTEHYEPGKKTRRVVTETRGVARPAGLAAITRRETP